MIDLICFMDSKTTSIAPEDVFRSFDINTLERYLKWLRKEREASISNMKRVRGILINFYSFMVPQIV